MTRSAAPTPLPRGGRRPGAGRPPSYTEPLLRKTVTLPTSYITRLTAAGRGNLSDGIRLVLEHTRRSDGSFWLDSPPPAPHSADCPATLICGYF